MSIRFFFSNWCQVLHMIPQSCYLSLGVATLFLIFNFLKIFNLQNFKTKTWFLPNEFAMQFWFSKPCCGWCEPSSLWSVMLNQFPSLFFTYFMTYLSFIWFIVLYFGWLKGNNWVVITHITSGQNPGYIYFQAALYTYTVTFQKYIYKYIYYVHIQFPYMRPATSL